ncbi:hypothetical protein [Pelagibius sp.]|uniref:hypothetical protein n=1 Tax=Pelagibius sp. TaxID=1931238 RepID=UPI00260E1279|nr:hypothetical protein [Pelagibius sp.]
MTQSRKEKVLIVRLWYEPREAPDAPQVLRGTIVDVESGEQRGVASLGEVSEAIAAKLQDLRPGSP